MGYEINEGEGPTWFVKMGVCSLIGMDLLLTIKVHYGCCVGVRTRPKCGEVDTLHWERI